MIFLKVLFYLAALVLVLALAYYTTRTLGRGMSLKQRTAGMQVLDQMAVGRDTFLVVVKVQEKILLLGISPAGVAKLDELDSYAVMEQTGAAPDFASALSSQIKSLGRRDNQGRKGGRGKE